MRTADEVRRELLVARRFLSELEEGITAIVSSGLSESLDPDDEAKWRCILAKRDRERETVAALDAELWMLSNR